MSSDKISYNLIQIKSLGFSLDIPEDFNLEDRISDSTIFYNLEATIIGNLSGEYVDILIEYVLWIGQKEIDERSEELTSIIVRNRFLINHLGDHLTENNGELAEGFKEFLVGVSLGHTRGIHAEKVQGTQLEGGYLPFVDEDDILEDLITSENYE